jgi:hypothetical protein
MRVRGAKLVEGEGTRRVPARDARAILLKKEY